VFFGFGILPLICATILWTLLGPLTPAQQMGVSARRIEAIFPGPELS
jgi:hypothetical protein